MARCNQAFLKVFFYRKSIMQQLKFLQSSRDIETAQKKKKNNYNPK